MLSSPATVLIAALNHLLRGNIWARQRLAPYAGRQALICIPPFQIGFVVTNAGGVDWVTDPRPDVTITLPADSPFRLLDGLDPLMGAACVEGNAEFATELSFVFRHLRWDTAEDLAQVFGDVAAQRIINTAHGFLDWQKQAAANLLGNFNEYVAFENQVLVTHAEFEAFSNGISLLANNLSRLELRVARRDDMPSRQRRLS